VASGRITVDQYEQMVRAGELEDPDRVELINGSLVDKMAKSPEHGYSTRKAVDKLMTLRGMRSEWTWRVEQPVRIPDYDEPEPDVAIVRGSIEDYEHRLPVPTDVGLLIEVSLTTLALDRGEKLSAYATRRIPVYWIVNLAEDQIEVYTDPRPGRYQSRQDFKRGQKVPVVLDGRGRGKVAVNDILPSPQAAP
jgi:Uma2 family endonuclease